jgi:hypothetical protein
MDVTVFGILNPEPMDVTVSGNPEVDVTVSGTLNPEVDVTVSGTLNPEVDVTVSGTLNPEVDVTVSGTLNPEVDCIHRRRAERQGVGVVPNPLTLNSKPLP